MDAAATTRDWACPRCGAHYPTDIRCLPWCEACGWNVEPTTPPARTLVDRLNLRLADEAARRLEGEMIARTILRARFTPSRAVAIVAAMIVHGLTAMFILLAVVGIMAGGAGIVLGICLLAVAWTIRPRTSRLPQGSQRRSDLPRSFALLDRVAAGVGTRPPDLVVIDPEFNLWFSRMGWRRRRVVGIGLALFEVLTPQERVAALGHEMGHAVNGDSTRGLVVGTAINTLVAWYGLFRPNRLGGGARGLTGLLAVPFTLVLVAMSRLIELGVLGFMLLLRRDGQRAEYLADLLSARVAGTSAAISTLDKAALGDNFARRAKGATVDRRFLDAWRDSALQLPDREWERIRRVGALEASRLSATHPPTASRLRVLRGRPPEPASVTLGAGESESIDAELRRAGAW
jgi:Zn-dependent protease with chaperone function